MTASEARAALPEILDRVLRGEEVEITRHGKPVAVVVSPNALRVRRADRAFADADRVRDLIVGGIAIDIDGHRPPITADRAEELIRHIEAGRAERS